MKIYTSYFAKGKTLRAQGIKIISIALYPPPHTKFDSLLCLAPTHSILYDKYRTDERYTHRYINEVLGKIDANNIIEQISSIARGSDVALCCYEKPNEFCHRHLVAKWIQEHTGMEVEEFGSSRNKEVIQTELF